MSHDRYKSVTSTCPLTMQCTCKSIFNYERYELVTTVQICCGEVFLAIRNVLIIIMLHNGHTSVGNKVNIGIYIPFAFLLHDLWYIQCFLVIMVCIYLWNHGLGPITCFLLTTHWHRNDESSVVSYHLVIVYIVFAAQHWILSAEPHTDQQNGITLVEDVIVSQGFTEASNQLQFLRRALLVNPTESQRIADLTCGQRDNCVWSSVRKLRFTASNFGPLLRAVKLKR